MLRAAQMLMGYTLRRHYLGTEWRIPKLKEELLRKNEDYCEVFLEILLFLFLLFDLSVVDPLVPGFPWVSAHLLDPSPGAVRHEIR